MVGPGNDTPGKRRGATTCKGGIDCRAMAGTKADREQAEQEPAQGGPGTDGHPAADGAAEPEAVARSAAPEAAPAPAPEVSPARPRGREHSAESRIEHLRGLKDKAHVAGGPDA